MGQSRRINVPAGMSAEPRIAADLLRCGNLRLGRVGSLRWADGIKRAGIKSDERWRDDKEALPRARETCYNPFTPIWIAPPACNNLCSTDREEIDLIGGSDLRLIWPWQDRNRRFSWLKASTFALILFPAIRFVYDVGTGEYGIFPIAFGNMTYWSGVWATAILLMALAVTPALTIFRWHALIDVRRMIGVTALVYTIVHVVIYFGLRSWNFALIVNESVTRLTLIVATLSTIGLIALGATSLDAAIRYMGAKNWQRLHTTNYVISGLAVLHVVLARGTYAEQYMLTGLFVWLMVWRALDRYGQGADARALAMLAVTSCLFTAFLEAGFLWGRRGYEPLGTLANNFNLAMLEVGIPPAWQVLAFGLLFALAAAGREALRVKAGSLAARQIG
jgi:sulfoxide reductase heme-binding subunit YedZ